MAHPIILGDQVWCPRCERYVQLLKIRKAAKIADVNSRTIYRYIEEGKIYSTKIASTTTRICSSCLLREEDEISISK
jgi:hypothetical protein